MNVVELHQLVSGSTGPGIRLFCFDLTESFHPTNLKRTIWHLGEARLPFAMFPSGGY